VKLSDKIANLLKSTDYFSIHSAKLHGNTRNIPLMRYNQQLLNIWPTE